MEKQYYTISDFLKDKVEKEDEIEALYDERERLNTEIDEKEEKYKLFVNDYLKRNSLQIRNFEEE